MSSHTIAIIGDSTIPDYPCRDLINYARQLGCNVKYVPLSRLSIIIDNDIKICLREHVFNPEGIFLRSIGLLIDLEQYLRRIALIRYLEHSGIITINPLDALLRSRNKLETMLILHAKKLPIPPTVSTEDLLYAYMIVKQFGDVVIKPIQGSRGYGAVKLSDADVAFHVMKTLINFKKPIYIQKYVNKPNRDIRVMVIDGEVFGCIYRISINGSWKTNIAQGAIGKPCENRDPELEEIAIRAVEALGLIYGGVDIGESGNGYVIFEVNGSPDWRELTKVLGKNPAGKLIEVMINRLRR